MDKQTRGFLYGLCLGDGCLYKQSTNKNTGLTIGHGPKQLSYLMHKAEKLRSVFGGKPVRIYEYNSFNKTSGKNYTNFQIRKVDPYFNQMHRLLYKTGKKIITRDVLDFLSDEGLAYWFMDDGSGVVIKSRDGHPCGCMVRFSTYCDQSQAKVLADWFLEKYNIVSKFDVDKRNDKVSLRFGTLDSIVLAKILSPYIIPEMGYKIRDVLNYTPRVLGSTAIVDEDIV
jgi:hypothetical protein